VLEPGAVHPRGPAEKAFVNFGGYMYFDNTQNVIATLSIEPAPLGTLGLMFGRPQRLSFEVEDTLSRQGRFQEVTLQPLADKGATHFAWIRPQEFTGKLANADGCFAYKFVDGVSKYFPIVRQPIFTKELLEETLTDLEAWVVIRNTEAPAIETPAIFDKNQSLEENMSTNEGHGNYGGGGVSTVIVTKEDGGGGRISYDEWKKSTDKGTIANPWIFEVRFGQAAAAATGGGAFEDNFAAMSFQENHVDGFAVQE
jgi:hypothetical protein